MKNTLNQNQSKSTLKPNQFEHGIGTQNTHDFKSWVFLFWKKFKIYFYRKNKKEEEKNYGKLNDKNGIC